MNHALRKLREERLLTQQDLAELAQLTITTVSRIENGKTQARPRTIRALARALKMEPMELRRLLQEQPPCP